MDAKIPDTFWSDPDLDGQPAEVLLTLAWIKTHPARNVCGAYRFSASRFTDETRLPAEWHQKTLTALPERFCLDGRWVLYVPFIRECLRLGSVTGKNGFINKGAQALTTPFFDLPPTLQHALREHYPDFSAVWPTPYQPLTNPLPTPWQALHNPLASPSQPLADSEALGKPLASPSDNGNQQVAPAERSVKAAAPEALGNPLPRGRAEQSRAAQSRAEEGMQGEGTGGALVATESEVLEFARTFADLARGWTGIPEAYALDWFSWRCTPKAGPFPRDWRGDLRRRFSASVLRGEIAPNNLAEGKTGVPSRRLHELKTRLEKGGLSPEDRAALREEIRKLENP